MRSASLIAPVFLPAAELYAVAIPLADPTAAVVANTVSCKACLKSSNDALWFKPKLANLSKENCATVVANSAACSLPIARVAFLM